MKRLTKIALAVTLVVLCSVSMAACGGKIRATNFGGPEYNAILKAYEAKEMATKVETVDLGTGIDFDVSGLNDNFYSYNQEITPATGSPYTVYKNLFNLKTRKTVPNIGDKDNASVNVYGEGKDMIVVDRWFDVGEATAHLERALFHKDGTVYKNFGFSKELYNSGMNPNVLYDTIFTINDAAHIGKVFNNGDVIIEGNLQNFEMYKDELIMQYGDNSITLFDLKGNVVYVAEGLYSSIFGGGNVGFYPLSTKRGVYVTTQEFPEYFDAPYTFVDIWHMNKVRITYELVEFKTGKRTEAKLDYMPLYYLIGGDPQLMFMPLKDFGELMDMFDVNEIQKAAMNYSTVVGYKVVDKLVSTEMSVIVVDDQLNIKSYNEGDRPTVIASNRVFLEGGISNNMSSLLDGSGKVIARFRNAWYNKASGLIKDGDGNYYDKNGKLVIDARDYEYIEGFVGKYTYAEKKVDGVTKLGYVDTKGNFVALDLSHDSLNDRDIGRAYEYGMYTLVSDAATNGEFRIINYAGTVLKTIQEANYDSVGSVLYGNKITDGVFLTLSSTVSTSLVIFSA